jgi:hypothetical protein
MTEAELIGFVEGNLLFMGLHELGHAIISEFEIPVIGREEDGVDRLAIWALSPEKTDAEQEPEYLIHSVFGWMTMSRDSALNKIQWWAAHGTHEQRGYQVGCLLYGSNPPMYKALADKIALPRERRESCAREAAQNARSWTDLMRPHIRTGGETGLATPESIVIDYAKSREYADERRFLMDIQMLESLRTLVRLYKFRSGVTLRTMECGEANAFWDAGQRTLTICYELATQYGDMAEPRLDEIRAKSAGR